MQILHKKLENVLIIFVLKNILIVHKNALTCKLEYPKLLSIIALIAILQAAMMKYWINANPLM